MNSDGTVVSTMSVTVGGTYAGLTDPPAKVGHTFAGWYLNADFSGEAITASTVVTNAERHTLYAKWTPIEYTVTINLTNASISIVYNGQTYTSGTFKAAYGTSFTVESVDAKDGFKDPNLTIGGSTFSSNTKVSYTVTGNVEVKVTTSKDSCITPDTLITLADGTQVMVKDLTGDEELLVWNFFTGTYDKAPILFIDYDEEQIYEVIYLTFSDGTVVKVISEHGFFDYDLMKYVYLDRYAAEYIGHSFDKSGEKVQLVDVEIKEELTTAWSPVTYSHLCYYVNGMLSMPGGISGLFNIFEIDPETMKYDEAKMLEDIETYGILTYEEFAEMVPVPEVMYDVFNGKYLGIAIGKGIVTIDYLNYLASRYSVFFE